MTRIERSPGFSPGPLPVLSSPGYLGSKSGDCGWLTDGSRYIAFVLDRRAIFTRLVFTDRVRIVGDMFGTVGVDIEKAFLDECIAHLGSAKICDFVAKSQSNVVFSSCPDGAECVPWGTYEVDLSRDPEMLLASFDGKHRNVIRKAQKDGIVVRATDDTDVVYANIRATLNRQHSIHFPGRDYLRSIRARLPDNSRLYAAYDAEGVLQGTAVVVFDAERAYYMYGGSIEHPHTGSLNLLQYEAMLGMKTLGVRVYDLVGARIHVEPGSKYEGIQRFKSRFGATLRSGLAFRAVFRPFRFKAFNAITKAYLGLRGYSYEDPIDQLKESR